MACYHPLAAWREEPEGKPTFGLREGDGIEQLRIPCGACLGCTDDKAEEWSVRLQHEAMTWPRSHFITLTYDDDHVPWYGLDLQHLQLFLKRLRKRDVGISEWIGGRRPIRYFAAGEYGGNTARPHYHLCLFNADLRERNQNSPILEETWEYGFHTVTPFTPGRARYIARYALKKIPSRYIRLDPPEVINPETGEIKKQKQEFAVMSRGKGLGALFFEKYRSDLLRGYVTDKGGTKRRMPRYYRNKLREDPAYVEAEKLRIQEYQQGLPLDSDSEEKRAAREAIHKAKIRTYRSTRRN